jgi:hypothetical protein
MHFQEQSQKMNLFQHNTQNCTTREMRGGDSITIARQPTTEQQKIEKKMMMKKNEIRTPHHHPKLLI